MVVTSDPIFDELLLQLRYLRRILGVKPQDQEWVLVKFNELEAIIHQLRGVTKLDEMTEGRLRASKVVREIVKKVYALPGYENEYENVLKLFGSMFRQVTRKHTAVSKICYRCGRPSGFDGICPGCRAIAAEELRARTPMYPSQPSQIPVRYTENPIKCRSCGRPTRYVRGGPRGPYDPKQWGEHRCLGCGKEETFCTCEPMYEQNIAPLLIPVAASVGPMVATELSKRFKHNPQQLKSIIRTIQRSLQNYRLTGDETYGNIALNLWNYSLMPNERKKFPTLAKRLQEPIGQYEQNIAPLIPMIAPMLIEKVLGKKNPRRKRRR
jgi:hypothetical protein